MKEHTDYDRGKQDALNGEPPKEMGQLEGSLSDYRDYLAGYQMELSLERLRLDRSRNGSRIL